MPYKTKSPYKKRKMAPTNTKALERRVRALETATELKQKDLIVQDTLISTTASPKSYPSLGSVRIINELSAGTTNADRIGDVVTWKKMFMRVNNVFAGLACNYRTAIVWDNDGGTPSYREIFSNDATPSESDPQAGINLSNRARFKVLYDSINSRHSKSQMQLSVATGDAAALQTIVRDTGETYIDLGGCKSVFELGANLPTTGCLYLVTIANQLENSTEPTIIDVDDYISQISFRLRYTDA